MDSKNILVKALVAVIAAIIMVGCGGRRMGLAPSTDGGIEVLTLQYELVHMEVPTRTDRGDPVVGIRFYNPNDIPVNVDRITLTKLGTAGNGTIEISMTVGQNVLSAFQSVEGDKHTFTQNLTIPPGEHLVDFKVFVSEPCQTIGYTVQSDEDIEVSGQDGEEVQVQKGPNSVIAEPVQVFGHNIHFTLDVNNPPSQDVSQGSDDVVAIVFNLNAQMWVEGTYAFVFMDYVPWEIAQQVEDITLSTLVDGEWISALGSQQLNPGGCFTDGLDCYVEFPDIYSIFDVCTDVKYRVEFSLSPTIPMSTEIQFIVQPTAFGFYDLEKEQVLTSENTSGDVLRGGVFTVVQ